jgi:hypothetical protein
MEWRASEYVLYYHIEVRLITCQSLYDNVDQGSLSSKGATVHVLKCERGGLGHLVEINFKR